MSNTSIEMKTGISDYIIESAPSLDPVKTERGVIVTERFLNLWVQSGRGMRWIILDHLRRFDEHIQSKQDLRKIWSRIKISGIHYDLCGDVRIKPKTIKYQNLIELDYTTTYLGPDRTLPEIPEDIIKNIKTSPDGISLEEIIALPTMQHKGGRILYEDREKAGIDEWDIDPVAGLLMERIPEDLRNDVKHAINVNNMTFMINYPLGNNTKQMGIGFGVSASKGKKKVFTPQGKIAENIYFQNEWLMIKLKSYPESLHGMLEPGEDVGKYLDITVDDGAGKKIRPFDGMIVSKRRRGKTWMGPHIQIKMERNPDV